MIAKKRVALYIVSFIFLVITAVIVILIAQGYYFDFKNMKLKKQGMIVVRSIPKNSNVYLDNVFKKNKTPLNLPLFTGDYEIRVEKEKYLTWTKKLNVKTGLVAWADYVFLILKDRGIEAITSEGVKNYLISDDATKAAFTDLKNNVWIADIGKNEHKKLYSSEVNDKNITILDWSENKNSLFVLKENINGSINYKLLKDSGNITFEKLPKEIKKIKFIPGTSDRFIFLSDANLYLLNEFGFEIIESSVSDFSLNSKYTYFTKNNGIENEIWRMNPDFKDKKSLLKEKDKNIVLFPGEKNRLVYTAGDKRDLFFLGNNNTKQKIGSEVIDVKWSKSDKKIVYRTNQEIHIYVFESDNSEEPKSSITTRLSKKIEDIEWFYDFDHIIFLAGNEINFSDFDGENSITLTNSAGLGDFKTSKNGKSLIFSEEKNGLKNIKIMKLSE